MLFVSIFPGGTRGTSLSSLLTSRDGMAGGVTVFSISGGIGRSGVCGLMTSGELLTKLKAMLVSEAYDLNSAGVKKLSINKNKPMATIKPRNPDKVERIMVCIVSPLSSKTHAFITAKITAVKICDPRFLIWFNKIDNSGKVKSS